MNPRERRAARHLTPTPDGRVSRGPRPDAITVRQVVDAALQIAAAEGYDALTMRRLATALDTGPASLYAHVVNKADLDELLIGRLCADIAFPRPDSASWRTQLLDVCSQLRDAYLRYPGISRAALALIPTDVEIARVMEGLLAILFAGGVAPQAAAWTADALLLYVAAYCLETSLVHRRSEQDDVTWVHDRAELRRRLASLPPATFPLTSRHAEELVAGDGHDRFDFTIGLMLDGVAAKTD